MAKRQSHLHSVPPMAAVSGAPAGDPSGQSTVSLKRHITDLWAEAHQLAALGLLDHNGDVRCRDCGAIAVRYVVLREVMWACPCGWLLWAMPESAA